MFNLSKRVPSQAGNGKTGGIDSRVCVAWCVLRPDLFNRCTLVPNNWESIFCYSIPTSSTGTLSIELPGRKMSWRDQVTAKSSKNIESLCCAWPMQRGGMALGFGSIDVSYLTLLQRRRKARTAV